MQSYFVYILTNKNRKVLYIGVTRNLEKRLADHRSKTDPNSFTAKYNCHNLVYWEEYDNIGVAIEREKELKGWIRSKKDALISSFNPDWQFFNELV